MAGFRNWRVTPGKFSKRDAAAKGTEGRRKSPASHGKRTRLRPALRGEEPAASEPGPGVGGRDRDRGIFAMAMLDARPRRPRPRIAPPNIDSVKICLPAKARPVKRILTPSI